VQNHQTKLWDIYGVGTAIGLQRKYQQRGTISSEITGSLGGYQLQLSFSKKLVFRMLNYHNFANHIEIEKKRQHIIEDPSWP